jgi:type VI secretion system protein ImpH
MNTDFLSEMIDEAGKPSDIKPSLLLELLREGHGFTYFQILRLLRLFSRERSKNLEPKSIEDLIWIRPNLSLAFPPADVKKVEERDGPEAPHFIATADFLGLYGTSSPLPTFYTEDLMSEASEDETTAREFFDIVNGRLFQLLFKCMMKYKQFLQVAEDENDEIVERLYCLLGIGEKSLRKDIRKPQKLLRYIGLFTQFPKSALGLQTLLSDALGQLPVEISPCQLRRAKIPEDQRMKFGSTIGTLGVDSIVGEEIDDRMGKFRVQVGPLKGDVFPNFFPGGAHYEDMVALTRLYVLDPLDFDLEIILAEGEARPISLGAPEWSRLGWDTWSFSGDTLGEVRVQFSPEF